MPISINKGDVLLLPIKRQRVECLIEYLIECLDFIDPDPDLEHTGDCEPDLAASSSSYWSSAGAFDGREGDGHEQWELNK